MTVELELNYIETESTNIIIIHLVVKYLHCCSSNVWDFFVNYRKLRLGHPMLITMGFVVWIDWLGRGTVMTYSQCAGKGRGSVQGMGNTCCPAVSYQSVPGLIPCTRTVVTVQILHNILEPIITIPFPVQCEWAIIRLNTAHTVAGGARTLDEENWIRAFPLTSVAAICKITDSKLLALLQPCLVSSSIQMAPPPST